MSTKKRIYIAGPMRGVKYFNFAAFDGARDFLQLDGWDVVSPADLDRLDGFDPFLLPENTDWTRFPESHMKFHQVVLRDIQNIMGVDALYMLIGWEGSVGAKAEKAIADWLGLEVLFQIDDLTLPSGEFS